jgi:hypothetical protein
MSTGEGRRRKALKKMKEKGPVKSEPCPIVSGISY